jgi:hypothetical protein
MGRPPREDDQEVLWNGAKVMRWAWPLLAFLVFMPLSASPGAGTKRAKGTAIAEIEQAVFRAVVRAHCEQMLCLLSIEGKSLDEQRLMELAKLGRVAAPLPGDSELDGSGMSRAARSRGAQLIDITRIIIERKERAVAYVHIYSTVIDATMCQYRVRRGGAQWTVDDAVKCTA